MHLERRASILARKKIVFVIVEGPSDQAALGVFLNDFFDKSKVFVHVMHGDITAQNGTIPSNILKRIVDEVKHYITNNSFKKTDIQQIIHIVDTDGAYISQEKVIEDGTVDRVQYFENKIICKRRKDLIDRNHQKSRNMDKLSETFLVWKDIPYSVYYMSCNLDHVLYNKLNTSDKEKEVNSFSFVKKYNGRLKEFIEYVGNSSFSVKGDYLSTWKYIKQGSRSLERHTNMGLCFLKEDRYD